MNICEAASIGVYEHFILGAGDISARNMLSCPKGSAERHDQLARSVQKILKNRDPSDGRKWHFQACK